MIHGAVGELGAARTAWAADSRLAVEISGADVSVVDLVDTHTGDIVDLAPVGVPAIEYRVISPAYRPSDGTLAVVCCHHGELVEGEPPHDTVLVLHDPTSGAERSRMRCRSRPGISTGTQRVRTCSSPTATASTNTVEAGSGPSHE